MIIKNTGYLFIVMNLLFLLEKKYMVCYNEFAIDNIHNSEFWVHIFIDCKLLSEGRNNYMNKKTNRTLALALVASMMLSACGNSAPAETPSNPEAPSSPNTTPTAPVETSVAESNVDKYPIKDLVIARNATRELESFNFLYSQRQEDSENTTNCYDGLLECDNKGVLKPCLAEEWGSEDGGLTWTFKIRDGLKWVDVNGNIKADNTAYDWATGLEWVLNFHKNDSANTSMPMEMIKGATEYYEWTKTLSAEEAYALTAGEGSKFLEMVGLEVPDANTVVYKCISEKPYFDTLALYNCLYPMSQGLVEELGVDGIKGMDNTTMWYNGAYLMTTFVHNTEKVFEPNPHYWDTESFRFNSVTTRLCESSDVMFQLYDNGEIDYVGLSEANVHTITSDPNHKYHDYVVDDIPSKYSYQFHWNYNKNDESTDVVDVNWNTAIANTAFRKSLYYGIELTDYYKRTNAVDPLKCENNYYTMVGLCTTSDGRDYTELVRENLGLGVYDGEKMVRFDAAKAAEYKTQAIEELTKLGVTFPVEMDYYISGASQTALDSANVLKDCVEKTLGADYVTLKICTYVSSLSQEVRNPRLQSFLLNGWGADYGDPMNYLGQEMKGVDNAVYGTDYANINSVEETEATKELLTLYEQYNEMVRAADAINDDMDARYEAFAKAEAFLLDNAIVMPNNYGKSLCLTKINIHSKMNAMYGGCNEKMKNWETNPDGYTKAEIEAYIAAK